MYWFLFLVFSWLTYGYLQFDQCFENCPKEEKMAVSEDLDMRNTTLDTGRRLQQILIDVSLFLTLLRILIEKVKKHIL